MKDPVRKSKKVVTGLWSIGGEGEKSDKKKEGGDKKVERGCERRTLNFLSPLLQKDQESLLEKNCFEDGSPGHDLGFLLALENRTLLNRCQDHQFWELHIRKTMRSSLQSKRVVCDLKLKFHLKLSVWQNKMLLSRQSEIRTVSHSVMRWLISTCQKK